MRSIRLSLLLYLLVLLALALLSISGLVYTEAERSLKGHQQIVQNFLKTKHEERCRSRAEQLDQDLLSEARNLAGLVTVQVQTLNPRLQALYSLGVLSGSLSPSGHCVTPLWIAEGFRGRNSIPFNMMGATLKFREVVFPHDTEGQITQYIQVNTVGGEEWRSPEMGTHSFPFDSHSLPGSQLVGWKFDDTDLADGVPVRRVTLKVSRFRVFYETPSYLRGRPWVRGGFGGRGRSEAPPKSYFAPAALTLFVQGACDWAILEEYKARSAEQLKSEVEESATEANESLQHLGHRLLTISLVTFLASLVGGFWLVHLGLSPLSRLSEAVSKVSPKDFRLPLKSEALPSELQPIAQRLMHTLDQLKRAFAREKQAAADISHELRTPLAAMLITLDVALRKPRPAEEYRELLEECRSSGQQMNILVEKMLALARLDAGADRLRPREVDVVPLAEQCANVVRPLADAKTLTLRVHHNGPAHLFTDPDKLHEVLINLLHNAVEYNQPEGSIDLSVEQRNGEVLLRVSDTGIGIPEEARGHIFERFYRADPSRHSEAMHAGIGLAIVKGYVDLMDGRIEVESAVGRGSTFLISLPAHF